MWKSYILWNLSARTIGHPRQKVTNAFLSHWTAPTSIHLLWFCLKMWKTLCQTLSTQVSLIEQGTQVDGCYRQIHVVVLNQAFVGKQTWTQAWMQFVAVNISARCPSAGTHPKLITIKEQNWRDMCSDPPSASENCITWSDCDHYRNDAVPSFFLKRSFYEVFSIKEHIKHLLTKDS